MDEGGAHVDVLFAAVCVGGAAAVRVGRAAAVRVSVLVERAAHTEISGTGGGGGRGGDEFSLTDRQLSAGTQAIGGDLPSPRPTWNLHSGPCIVEFIGIP